MLDFQPITFDLKTLVDSYTFKYGEGSCQHSFVSSWCLRHKYGDMFCERDNFLYTLRSKQCTEDYRVYLFPHGDTFDTQALKQALQNILDDAHEHNARVKFETLTLRAKDLLCALFPELFIVEGSRDLWEYLYNTYTLVHLPGNSLKSKRNSVNRFFRDYGGRAEIVNILPEHIEQIRVFQGEWLDEKLVRDKNPLHKVQLEQENDGVQEALDNFFALKLSGVVILIDGEMRGFMYGAPLTLQHFDAISGKGDADIQNISLVLKRELVRLCCESYEFVNFEEDLGIPGLRTMKTECCPEYMLRKFIATER